MQGAQNALAAQPKPATLNQRLTNAAESFTKACQRIEGMLARVNGTPQTGEKMPEVAKIAPVPPMLNSLEQVENQVERLQRLADGLENVA
jgi:hypothetical protein